MQHKGVLSGKQQTTAEMRGGQDDAWLSCLEFNQLTRQSPQLSRQKHGFGSQLWTCIFIQV